MNIYSPNIINYVFTSNTRTITGSYTIQDTDSNGLILCSGSASTDITVTGSFQPGTVIPILRYSPAMVNVVSGSGVNIRSAFGNTILNRYSFANLMYLDNNEWILYGDV